jgi:6-phosphogluconolactonase
MKKYLRIAGTLIIIMFLFSSCKNNFRLFVGGYTQKDGEKGFSVFDFNINTGVLKPVSVNDAGPNPSYFCYSPENNLFYAINEVMEFRGSTGGGITTLKYDVKSGSLEKKHELAFPNGGPCFVSMSADSGNLFVANYPGGSVAVVRLDDAGLPSAITDTIIFKPEQPDSSHAHMILSDPSGKLVYVSDLGMDMIRAFDFNTGTGKLSLKENGVTKVAEKSGPRHFTFNSNGTKLYLINELGSTIMVFNTRTDGSLEQLQSVSTLKSDYRGENACADIHLGKDGDFLYGSNRGENSIVTFRVGKDGLLTLAGSTPCGGNWPRNFIVDPSGKFLLVGNERSDNISVFRIDKKTGLPSQQVCSVVTGKPVCLKIYRMN